MASSEDDELSSDDGLGFLNDSDSERWGGDDGGEGDSERWDGDDGSLDADADLSSEDGDDDYNDDDNDPEEFEEDAEPTPIEAGNCLLVFLLDMLFKGVISARAVCVICYWVGKMGFRDHRISRFGLRPGSPSGHFQRHIDKRMGVSTRDARYRIGLPTYTRGGVTREFIQTPVLLPYEELLDEINDLPTFDKRLTAYGARRVCAKVIL